MSFRKVCKLRATITFGPDDGRRRPEAITGRFQPRIAVDKYLSSCIVESPDGDVKPMDFERTYDVLIRLPMWQQMEEFMGKGVQSLFPAGSSIALFDSSEQEPAASGTVSGIEFSEEEE